MSISSTPPEIAAAGKAIVASAATVVGSFKPSDKDRLPPPTLEVRVTFLAADGRYVAHETWREIGSSKPGGASSNLANSKPGATVQPTKVQSPSDCAACQA